MLPTVTIVKKFSDIPFAHRQHNHNGHCRFIHGHNWSFAFRFAAAVLDPRGFVIDFSGPEMKEVKEWLNMTFDHSLVLSEDDPHRDFIRRQLVFLGDSEEASCFMLAKLVILPSCSCEGIATWLHTNVSEHIYRLTSGRVKVTAVTVREDSKNSATSCVL